MDSRVQERKQQALKKHPLAVKLDINCKDGNSLHLTFNFLITLEIITVNISLTLAESNISSISGSDLLAPESVLTDLYPVIMVKRPLIQQTSMSSGNLV